MQPDEVAGSLSYECSALTLHLRVARGHWITNGQENRVGLKSQKLFPYCTMNAYKHTLPHNDRNAILEIRALTELALFAVIFVEQIMEIRS
jgi:hypothetical protein